MCIYNKSQDITLKNIALFLTLEEAEELRDSLNCIIKDKETEASAQVIEEVPCEDVFEEDASTRGLFTSLSLGIKGGESKIRVSVKNDFTLFPATVYVIVELYCSLDYQEKHENMKLVAITSTMDLNMGDTIYVEAPTGGVEQYWQGRMRYKIDSKGWEERNTGTVKYSATGEPLGIL